MNKENGGALEQIQLEELISGLIENGYGCCDNFLYQEIIDGLRANILSLIDLGDHKNDQIRIDRNQARKLNLSTYAIGVQIRKLIFNNNDSHSIEEFYRPTS